MTRRLPRPPALLSLAVIAASLLSCSVTLSALPVTQLDVSSTEGKHGRERAGVEDSAARADTCTSKSAVQGLDTCISRPDPLAVANARDGVALAVRPPDQSGRATATITSTEIYGDDVLPRTSDKSHLHSGAEIGHGRDHLTTGEDIIDSSLLEDPDMTDGPAFLSFSIESGTECSAEAEANSKVAHETFFHQEERTRMNGPGERGESRRDDVTNRNDDAAEQQNAGEIRGSAIGAVANMMQRGSIAVEENCGGPISCTWDTDDVGSKEQRPTVTASGGEMAPSMARFSTRPNREDGSVCFWKTGAIGRFKHRTMGSADDERPADSRVKSVVDQAAADLSESPAAFFRVDDVVVVQATAGALSDGAHAEKQHTGGQQGKEVENRCEDTAGRGGSCGGSADIENVGHTAPTSLPLPDGVGVVEHAAVQEARDPVPGQVETKISGGESSATTADVQSGGGHIGGSLVAGGIPSSPNREGESGDGKAASEGENGEAILKVWSREGLDCSILQHQEGSECAPPYSVSSSSSLEPVSESSFSAVTSCEDIDTDREAEFFPTAVPTDLGPENVRGPRVKSVGVSIEPGSASTNSRVNDAHEGHAAREQASRDGVKRPESAQTEPQPVLKSQLTDDVIADPKALGLEVASIASKEGRGEKTDADGSMDVADNDGTASEKEHKLTGQGPRGRWKEKNWPGKAASPAEVVGKAGRVAKVQQHSWWRLLGWWAVVAVMTICAGFVYTGGEILRSVPGFGDSRYRRWGLDLDAAIAAARSRGTNFLDSASGYPPHNDDDYSDLPELVSDERSSAEGATVKGCTSRHRDAAATDNVIWDTRPKKSPDVLVFDPVLGVVPFGVLEAWEKARPEARTQQPRPRQPGKVESEQNICQNGDAPLSRAPSTLPGTWGGISTTREVLLRSDHCTGGAVGAAAAVPTTERKMKKKRPSPPVRYSPEWHAWLAARHEGRSPPTVVNGEKQPNTTRQAPATNGKGSNLVGTGGCGAGGDGAVVVVRKGGQSQNGGPSDHVKVGPPLVDGLHSGNCTGNDVVMEMNGDRASGSVGSGANCGSIYNNAWH